MIRRCGKEGKEGGASERPLRSSPSLACRGGIKAQEHASCAVPFVRDSQGACTLTWP